MRSDIESTADQRSMRGRLGREAFIANRKKIAAVGRFAEFESPLDLAEATGKTLPTARDILDEG